MTDQLYMSTPYVSIPVAPKVFMILEGALDDFLSRPDHSIFDVLSELIALLQVAGVDAPQIAVGESEPFRCGPHLAGMTLVLAQRAVAEAMDVVTWRALGIARLVVWSRAAADQAILIGQDDSAPGAEASGPVDPEDAVWLRHVGDRSIDVIRVAPKPWEPERVASWFARSSDDRANAGPDGLIVYTKTLSPGGAERQWVYLAISLFAAGHRVNMVVETIDGSAGHYLPLLRQVGVPVVVTSEVRPDDLLALPSIADAVGLLRARLMPDSIQVLRLAALIARFRTRAIFAELDEPNLVGGVAGLLGGVRAVVLSFRNYNPTTFSYLDSSWYLPVYHHLVSSPAVHMAGNHAGANDDYARWIGCPPERVSHIPNALDESIFPLASADEVARLRIELAIDVGSRVLLGVFRLSEEKDPLTFLAVCRKVIPAVRGLKVLIAGVGPYADILNSAIAEARLDTSIRLLGRRSDIAALMAMSDLMLLTSRQEGMPNVLMEAQLAGLPIVATAVGGVAATLHPKAHASILPPGDVDGLAEACVRLLLNPYQASISGRAGEQHARRAFALDAMRDSYLKLAGVLPRYGDEVVT